MLLRTFVAAVVAGALLCGLIGCSGSTSQSRSSRSSGTGDLPRISGGRSSTAGAQAADKAKAEQVDYFGLKALRLTNGLISVTAVPALGGRVMEYNLGNHAFLWANQSEIGGGGGEAAGTKAKWRNYGGYKVWPAPQSRWGGPPDPEGSKLDGGEWTGKIITASGQTAVVELTSPEDPQVTGLQMVRRLSLHAGTTQLDVQETFRNVSRRELTWGIWGITQVPGSVKPGEGPSADSRVYFPVNAQGRSPEGFFAISDDTGGQFKKVANGKVVETSYRGKVAKVGADSTGGWIAHVNELQDLSLVQTFKATAGGDYPDNGSIVQVYTSPASENYIEMEINSPLTKLAPGADFSFSQTWYCAGVSGPLVKVTEAGAIAVHPTAARKGKQIVITGTVGVFAPGELTVVFLDDAGKKLDASKPISATPTKLIRLNLSAAVPDTATSAMLILSDAKGSKIGNLAEIPLQSAAPKPGKGN